MSNIDILRVVTLISALAGVFILFLVARRRKDKWLYTVPPLLLLINLAVFGASRLVIGPLPVGLIPVFNSWAIVIQLQLAFTVIGIGGFYLWKQ